MSRLQDFNHLSFAEQMAMWNEEFEHEKNEWFAHYPRNGTAPPVQKSFSIWLKQKREQLTVEDKTDES